MSDFLHYDFLNYVKGYITKHPEVGAVVSDYVAAGITEALKESNQRALDMEVALVAATAVRYKNANALILDKLKKWQGKTAIRWDDLIKKLESKDE